MKYFAKELPNQPFWFADGTKANYTVVTGTIGLIELHEDDPKWEELTKAAKQHVAGVSELNPAEYGLKKKLLLAQQSSAAQKEPEPPKFRLVFPGKETLLPHDPPAPAATAKAELAAAPAAAQPAQAAGAPAAPLSERPMKTVKPKVAKLMRE
jgi:hypothetical protein